MAQTKRQKDRLYTKRNRIRVFSFALCAVILTGYLSFYILSSMLPKDSLVETPFNTEISFGEDDMSGAERIFTLYEWDYCEEKNTMEVKMKFFNGEFDGIDDYVYYITTEKGSTKDVKIEPVMSNSLMDVIRIQNIKPGFDFITLYFAPDKEEISDADIGSVSIYEEHLRPIDKIVDKSENRYLIERLESVIASYTEDNRRLKREVSGIDEKIRNIRQQSEDIEMDKAYQTVEEAKLSDEEIQKNDALILSLQKEKDELIKAEESNTSEIESAKRTLENIAPSSWAREEVTEAINNSLVPVSLQDEYKDIITRVELSDLIVTFIEKSTGESIQDLMAEKGLRYPRSGSSLSILKNMNIYQGDKNGDLHPDGYVNKEQLRIILNRTVKLMGISETGDEQKGWVTENDLMSGTDSDMVTREQAMIVIYRAYVIIQKTKEAE